MYIGDGGNDRWYVLSNTVNTVTTWTFTAVTGEAPGQSLVAGDFCTQSGAQVKCDLTSNTNRVRADTGGGDDLIDLTNEAGTKLVADMGPGDDSVLTPYSTGNVVDGGTGDDALRDTGEPGFADQFNGGDDDDDLRMYGGMGDVASGGGGIDTIQFFRAWPAPEVPYQITLDGQVNDGERGANPTGFVEADIENLLGGSEDDLLTGNGAANKIEGGGGNDDIAGDAGQDELIGGLGNDVIAARDGEVDTISCGEGTDSVVADRTDVVANDCEVVDLPPIIVVDGDADGISPPADCDDANPNIKPGTTDVPDNGIDENCDGADAINLDRDGDGAARPADCDDTNPDIRPGAPEIPGNQIDEDCDGVTVPFPTLDPAFATSFRPFARHTIVNKLNVRRLPAGTTVQVDCSAKTCPFKSRTFTYTKGTFKLGGSLKRRRLKTGSTLTLTFTAPNSIGVGQRYTFRKRRAPATKRLCVPAGASKASAC